MYMTAIDTRTSQEGHSGDSATEIRDAIRQIRSIKPREEIQRFQRQLCVRGSYCASIDVQVMAPTDSSMFIDFFSWKEILLFD